MNFLPISVIILTYNESKNITDCLESIKELSDDIIIVDSGSTDDTLLKASSYSISVHHHPFENYSKQRNWAFQNIDTRYEWILNMDADHRLTKELIAELREWFSRGIPPDINGFMASRRTMFLDQWIRYGGHYPVYHGVLFRKGYGQCENKEYDQHFIIQGNSKVLKGDVIDIITDSLSTFVTRHNRWATLEANDILNMKAGEDKIKPNKKRECHGTAALSAYEILQLPHFLESIYLYVLPFCFKERLFGWEGRVDISLLTGLLVSFSC